MANSFHSPSKPIDTQYLQHHQKVKNNVFTIKHFYGETAKML